MTVRVYPESSHWQICFSLPKYYHKNKRSTAKNKHNCLRSLNCNLNWLAAAEVHCYYLHFTLPFLSACDSAKFFFFEWRQAELSSTIQYSDMPYQLLTIFQIHPQLAFKNYSERFILSRVFPPSSWNKF